jgi:isopropylmalate/homocitrate/citramalate synthase
VAATLYAAKQGAHMLVGTVNGFGGSVDLATVIPVLQVPYYRSITAALLPLYYRSIYSLMSRPP